MGKNLKQINDPDDHIAAILQELKSLNSMVESAAMTVGEVPNTAEGIRMHWQVLAELTMEIDHCAQRFEEALIREGVIPAKPAPDPSDLDDEIPF